MYSQDQGTTQLRGYSQNGFQDQQRKSRGGGYQFAAQPKAIKSKSKYRDPNDANNAFVLKDKTNRSGKFNNNDDKGNISRSERNWAGQSDENFNGTGMSTQYVELQDPPIDQRTLIPYFYVDRPPTPEY